MTERMAFPPGHRAMWWPIKRRLNQITNRRLLPDTSKHLSVLHRNPVSVSADSLLKLQSLSQDPRWVAFNQCYTRAPLAHLCDLLNRLVHTSVHKVDAFDVKRVQSVTSGKEVIGWGRNGLYADMLEWGKHMYEDERIGYSSEAHLVTNIEHTQNAVLGHNNYLSLHNYTWHNNRYCLSLENGAHHLAALIRQVTLQGRVFCMPANIKTHTIDYDVANELSHQAHVLITQANDKITYELSKAAGIGFFVRPSQLDTCRQGSRLQVIVIPKSQRNVSRSALSRWVDAGITQQRIVPIHELYKNAPGLNIYRSGKMIDNI